MKKLLITIVLTISMIFVLSDINVYAASSRYVFLIKFENNRYYNYVYNCSPTSVLYEQNGTYYISGASLYYNNWWNTLQQALDNCNSKVPAMPDTSYGTTANLGSTYTLIISQGITNNAVNNTDIFGSYDDYLNPPQDSTWYSEMWDTLKEELGDPAFWFGEWFINIIDGVFGNDEQNPTGPPKPPTSTHVQINNPTITPAPTPIPYTTVVIPKTDPVTGDTYYEENYYYINPSGTPIITSSPPTNPPSQNGSGNGTDYSPVGGDPYSIPQVSWLTNATIGDNDYDGILSISQGMDSIDEIGSDYVDGMGAVQDATGTLPTSWLLLIGIAAAIPLIAGIISRFLS